jgi:serine/threonine protein kinase
VVLVSQSTGSSSGKTARRRLGDLQVQAIQRQLTDLMRGVGTTGSGRTVASTDSLDFQRFLGQGSFGVAELYTHKADNADVVRKRIPVRALESHELSTLLNEVAHSAALRHEYVVEFYGACIEDGLLDGVALSLFLEFAQGGTLAEAIDSAEARDGRLPTAWVTCWLSQICSAVAFMHTMGMLHRDLTAHNMFLTSVGDIRVGDLGLSKKLSRTASVALESSCGR